MPGSHNEALPDTAHLESLANIRPAGQGTEGADVQHAFSFTFVTPNQHFGCMQKKGN